MFPINQTAAAATTTTTATPWSISNFPFPFSFSISFCLSFPSSIVAFAFFFQVHRLLPSIGPQCQRASVESLSLGLDKRSSERKSRKKTLYFCDVRPWWWQRFAHHTRLTRTVGTHWRWDVVDVTAQHFFFQFFSAEESRRSENLMTSFNERLVIHHAQSVIRDRSATDYLPLFVAIVVVVAIVTIHWGSSRTRDRRIICWPSEATLCCQFWPRPTCVNH